MAQLAAEVITKKPDKAGKVRLFVRDTDTKKTYSVYARNEEGDALFSGIEKGSKVIFTGTWHPFFEDVKMIASSVLVE